MPIVGRAVAALLFCGSAAWAQSLPSWSDERILGTAPAYHIDSLRVRFTHFDQEGFGYQSQAGPPLGPGSQAVTVEQPTVELVAQQGRVTHRLFFPIDVITAASPDAIDGWPPPDAISQPSRINVAGNLDLASTYHASRATDWTLRAGFHLEENFRSWNVGGGVSHSFADDNAVVSASVNQFTDWFDRFTIHGSRIDRTARSSTNANLALTQLLSSTTVAHINYGVTVQVGELGNTWNSVPLDAGFAGDEILPRLRHRHAFVGRLVQWLPWQGALHLFYRFYADDWGVLAHTAEASLYQHITRYAQVRVSYRVHQQNGVDFFVTRAHGDEKYRTADSDLGPFVAQTFGAMASLDLPLVGRLRMLHADFGYERYLRSNDLRVNIYSCSFGFRF